MADRVGQQLGNYRLLRLLGQGGQASVYLGEHLYLKSLAALKVRHTVLTDEERAVFLQEVQTLVQLTHPHIVRVLDFALEDGMPFLVMEYAPHGTLRQRHPKGTQLPLDVILPYVKQVASALQYTHDHCLIHRDVKPENMLLSSHNEVLLSDFGLVILTTHSLSSGGTEPMEPSLAGTTPYLAPEQLRGKIRPASDQYALAVVVYEWLCGKPPFQDPFLEVAVQHVSAPPPSLHEQIPGLSPAIEEVVLQALAKEPEQRFASVQDFATVLERAYQEAVSPRLTPVLAPQHGAETGKNQSPLRNLPTGTMTLLFTDVEGSTRLLQQLGERYASVLSECRHLLSRAFQAHHGQELDTQGDSFFVVFPRATDAVSAAVAAQRTLASHPWPEGVAVRVRMGLHTGEPSLTAEGYVGLDVHRAARIMSAGHGGQVLLSQTTRDLVEHDLPDGVRLRDLRAHRLKDLQHPSHLFQLVISGLPADFPPLKTLDTHPNNLPLQPTSLIGREKEVAAVEQLLRREGVRLLTLTGPGGTGKTRLGLQIAAELRDHFVDGVFFVNLAPLSDPTLVIPTIAQTLEVKEIAEQSLVDQLKTSLRDKQLLLLLDNFEQVIEAAVQVAELLAACSGLKVLITSRAVLHVRGEHEFAVPPLAVPDPNHLPDLLALSQYEAVALFIARTQMVKSEFTMTSANAPAIAEICARLDGLPLAIELAAARSKLLPPQALLARLGWRLAVLTSGARDVPVRQQTLRNTLAWSYDLLTAEEQGLFRRLAVFVGGSTLEAIEAVCQGSGDTQFDVFSTIASLIDKSLVQQSEHEGGEPRLGMLETVREYGLACLQEHGEAYESQRAHALYYLAFAEEAEPHLKGGQQVLWWQRLEREQENLRAALAWLIEQEEVELAVRLSGALWWFWYIRGYWSEGWRWLEGTLELPQAQAQTASRAKALRGAGELAYRLGGLPVANSLLEQSVTISRQLGDKPGLSEALGSLGSGLFYRHSTQAAARTVLEESLALAREVKDPWILANALRAVGEVMRDLADYKSARLHLEESVALYRAIRDQQALSRALCELADVMLFEGQLTQAAALAEESRALARELNNGPDLTWVLYRLATIRAFQDYEQAAVLDQESLALAREQGDRIQMGIGLFTLASIAVLQGDLTQAETYVQESLALFRELGVEHKVSLSLALSVLGEIRRKRGNLIEARIVCKEGLGLAREAGKNYSIGWNLIGLARVAADEGQLEHAARLFGAAEPLLNPDVEMDPTERADYERAVEDVRGRLGEKVFATAWTQGRTLSPDQVLAALEPAMMVTTSPTETSSTPSAKAPTTYPGGLTARQVEILRLVAQGLTDAQIAERLVVSPRTVNWHLTTIYSKLQVSSRSAATRYAIEHHLV